MFMPQKFRLHKVKEVVKALEEVGFVFTSQKGSHMKFVFEGKHLTVPNHAEISIGTLNSIYKETCKITEKYKELNDLFLS